MSTAEKISYQLQLKNSQENKEIVQRFFKTGIGEYAQDDIFLGVKVPEIRKIAKENYDITIEETLKLLTSKIHEERLIALYFLINKYKNANEQVKQNIFNLYLSNTQHINNWDLVDTSCEHIVGEFLKDKPKNHLFALAKSSNLWERRIAVVSTFFFIKQKDHKVALEIVNTLLSDKHDLINKACGWMLREVGKRCSEKILTDYLEINSSKMSRTTLRYAIEKFDKNQREYFLKKDKQ